MRSLMNNIIIDLFWKITLYCWYKILMQKYFLYHTGDLILQGRLNAIKLGELDHRTRLNTIKKSEDDYKYKISLPFYGLFPKKEIYHNFWTIGIIDNYLTYLEIANHFPKKRAVRLTHLTQFAAPVLKVLNLPKSCSV